MKIDFHNHYYPPEYLEAVKRGPAKVRMDYDAEGNPRLHYPGDYNILVPGHRDLDYREGVLKQHGVDKQVITFTTPGTVTGSVRFDLYAGDACAGDPIDTETGPIVTGEATTPTGYPGATDGWYSRISTYLGDTDHDTGATTCEGFRVRKVATSTTLAATPSTASYHQAIIFSTTVTPSGTKFGTSVGRPMPRLTYSPSRSSCAVSSGRLR